MRKLAPVASLSLSDGGVWPTQPQQLLLRAALLDAPAAAEAWVGWQKMVRPDEVDIASWILIPLVYANLKRLGVNDPLLLQAKDCHLHYWWCNQKLFHLASGFLDELQGLKIPVLVLKGVALANLYYPDIGCRPMADLDLLVPAGKFLGLGTHLLQHGWKETDGHSFASFQMDRMPSFGFMRPEDGFCVDIHCHVLHANCAEGADDEFWARAQPWVFQQRNALTLAPEDHLLHIVSHGVRWCDVPPFRWIADAWWILARNRGRFDWERFLEHVRFHEISLPILRGLERMSRITPLDLPPDLLARLEALPVSARARVRFIAATHPLPRPFFSRARRIWRALGEEEGWNIRRALSLLLFACEVAVRDRVQILADSRAWMRGLFKKP